MSSMGQGRERADGPGPKRRAAGEKRWKAPRRSDQRPGEEVVQVNDAYTGGGPPPEAEPQHSDDQHRTGG